MGLDMYLTKKIHIGGEYEHRHVTGTVDLTTNGKRIHLDPQEVSEITSRVGYWRKANQIHAWFVREIQGGVDECQESRAPWEKLQELKALCLKALETKDASLLPPKSGFLFGPTKVDEYYWSNLQDTVDILTKLEEGGWYYYRSGW